MHQKSIKSTFVNPVGKNQDSLIPFYQLQAAFTIWYSYQHKYKNQEVLLPFRNSLSTCAGFGCVIFFLIPSIGLFFEFMLNRSLIIQGCLGYYWAALAQSQDIFCFSAHLSSKQAGGAQGAGRGHSWDTWAQLTMEIFHTVWYHPQQI